MTPAQIKTLRQSLNMTQQEFASLLGLSFVSINRWEQGHSAPTGLSLVLLQLLQGALARVQAQDLVRDLRTTGPEPLAIIRRLVQMEDCSHVPR